MKRPPNPYAQPCPYCHAPALSKCRDHLGRSVPVHQRRKDAARRASA